MAQKKIVAIGGNGQAPARGITDEIVRLAGQEKPRLLYVPTASNDAEDAAKRVEAHFGRLGCSCNVLRLVIEKPSDERIAEAIGTSDIIYVGGGNTLKMMAVWKRRGVDALLRTAWERGAVMCGESAGAICWFEYGNSDSRQKTPEDTTLIRVKCLGFLPGLCCPHYHGEKERRPGLQAMTRKFHTPALALDDNCALCVVDDQYRILTSRSNAAAYRVFWKDGAFHEVSLEQTDALRPVSGLWGV